MAVGHRKITNWNDWTFDCPEGTWTGGLDQKAWGKSSNLILYFSDQATGRQYWFSVFHRNGYRPRDNGHDFKNDAEPGDVFELTTRKTKKMGNPDLVSARKISSAPREAANTSPPFADDPSHEKI
jgi:hypothetical protein